MSSVSFSFDYKNWFYHSLWNKMIIGAVVLVEGLCARSIWFLLKFVISTGSASLDINWMQFSSLWYGIPAISIIHDDLIYHPKWLVCSSFFRHHLKCFWCCQFHVCFVTCGFQSLLWCLLSACLDCLKSWWVFHREHQIFEEVVLALSVIVSMLELYSPFVNSFIL